MFCVISSPTRDNFMLVKLAKVLALALRMPASEFARNQKVIGTGAHQALPAHQAKPCSGLIF